MRAERALRSNEFMLYALLVATICCVLSLGLLPRSLAPVELPPLVLGRDAVMEAVRADATARAQAPKSPDARAVIQSFLELGDLENQAASSATTVQQKRRDLAGAYGKLVRTEGDKAGLALRAQAVERLEAALDLKLSPAEAQRVLGLFPEALERHGVTQDGIEIAPHFVMRTLYKARWNLAVGREPDYALAPIEQQAYHGWLALHAGNLSPEPRSLALQRYAASGGGRTAEARGVLAFLANDYKQAVAALEHAYATSPTLRLRNWIRGAKLAASAVGAEP